MPNALIAPRVAADLAGIAADRLRPTLDEEMQNKLREVGADEIVRAQHAATLRWVRERLGAGEHLEDLLAEEPA